LRAARLTDGTDKPSQTHNRLDAGKNLLEVFDSEVNGKHIFINNAQSIFLNQKVTNKCVK